MFDNAIYQSIFNKKYVKIILSFYEYMIITHNDHDAKLRTISFNSLSNRWL